MPDLIERGPRRRRAGRRVRDRGRLDRRRPARPARPGARRAAEREPRRAPGPGHRGRRVHRQPPRRAAGRARAPACARSASTTRAARRAGSTRPTPADPRRARRPARRHPRRAVRRGRDRGRRGRLPPRRADRDPVLVRRRRVVRRHQRPGHAQRARGGPARRRRRGHPHLDERGLRHARRRCRSARPTRSRRSRRTRRPRSRPTSSRSRSSAATGCRSTVLRPFNTYGPRQSERAVLPTMLRQLLAGQPRDPARAARPAARPHLRRATPSTGSSGPATAAGHRRPRRSSSAPAAAESIGELFDARLPAARQSTATVRRGRRPRCDPDASEVLVLAVRSVARPRAARLGGHDRASRTGSRRPSTGCATSPSRHGRRPCPALSRPDRRSPSRRSAATPARYLEECLDDELRLVGRAVRRRASRRAFAAVGRGRRYAVACASGHGGDPPRPARPRRRAGRRGPRPDADLRRVGQPDPLCRRRRRSSSTPSPRPTTSTRRSSSTSSTGARGSGCASRRRSRSSTCSATRPTSSRSSRRPSATASPVIEDASEALGARLHRRAVRRPAGRDDRAGRLLQLQRQQAHHDRRRRDARHRRRGARAARPPPLDPGPAARARPTTTTRSATTTGSSNIAAALGARPARAARRAARRPPGERRRPTTPRIATLPGVPPGAARAVGRSVVLAVHGRRSTRRATGRSRRASLDAARRGAASTRGRSGRRSTGRGSTRDAPRLGGAVADADLRRPPFSLPSSSNLDPADQARVVAVLRDTLSPPRVSASRASAR